MLTGLTAIAGFQTVIDENAQATAEERLGGTVDPRHADDGKPGRIVGYASSTQAGSHGPYGLENQLLDDLDFWALTPAGDETQDPLMDRTPSRRAGPWPKGIASGPVPGEGPDDISRQLIQSYALHGIRTNASAKAQGAESGYVQNDEWEEINDVGPGTTLLQPTNRQAMSSGYAWGTRDRTQSFAPQNEHGFDSAHSHRRFATGSIPGNFMWMRPAGRPMVKTLAGPARPPIGSDSPFAGQDLGMAFGIDGAILQNVPSEYEAPPQPYLSAPVVSPDNDSVVEWY